MINNSHCYSRNVARSSDGACIVPSDYDLVFPCTYRKWIKGNKMYYVDSLQHKCNKRFWKQKALYFERITKFNNQVLSALRITSRSIILLYYSFLIPLLLLPILRKAITVLFSENLSRKSSTTTPLPAFPSAMYASPYLLKSSPTSKCNTTENTFCSLII